MGGPTTIFWPMIAQALLTFVIYGLLARRRFGAVYAGKVEARAYKIPAVEPEPSATAARSLVNQFELPVLFYVVCILFYLTSGANYIVLALAWAFVISRCIHAGVHVTANRLMLRQRLFMVGFVIAFAMWVLFAVHIL